jgi:prepilin-type N-terminal cleavage/methylation domain-containing protein
MNKKKSKFRRIKIQNAFTLIELMVTIAVMSILAGIVLINFSGVREGARIKSAEGLMSSAQNSAVACLARGKVLSDRVEKGFVCGTDGSRWPDLPGLWVYDTPTADASDISARTFTFSATGDGKTITCTEVSCTTT